MKLNNWSCIGAELQGDQIDIEKMTQIYFYRAASGETMDNMLSPNFFNSIYDRIKVNDLILLYHPENKDKRWIKVIKNIGGNVETEEIKGKTVEEAVKWLANRTNIFEIMPLVKYLSTKPFGKQTYIDINIDDFIRIPTKTFGEEAKEIQDIIQDVKEIPHTGAFIVDEQGTYGVVESAIINGNTYESITITTLIPGNTVKKSAKPTIIYGRNAGQEFDYVPTDTFDDSGSSTHLTTTLGLSQSFETPLSTNNKGASITEIKKVDDKIKKVDDKVNEVNKKADIAATSGNLIGSYWFGKTKADTTVPAPTLPGQNYYDFTTGQVYKSTDGATWTLDTTNTPPTDIDVQILITSKFWDITEQENQHGGEAKWSHTNSEWSYFPKMYEDIPAGGASLPLLTRLISDHKFNDISYLDANTFSWQSGSVYKAVYQHLVKDMASKRWGYAWNNTEDTVRWYTKSRNPKVGDYAYDWGEIYDNASVPSNLSHTVKEYDTTNDSIKIVSGGASFAFSEAKTKNAFNLDSITETIEGIEITYFVAEDGHRICLPDQETAISNLYAKTGKANFFILDTANAQFKLPRTQKRKLLRAVKNGDSWYNLYSDGWVEQGGCVLNAATGAHTITIPIEMADVEQLKKATIVSPIFINGTIQNQGVTVRNSSDSTWSTNQIDCFSWGATIHIRWQVSGYAAESVLANEPVQHEYYYVGNFERSAIQQTAGLNAELFNNKVDVGHQIIDFQAPTAENNYTWYRKYADGWVEQGGYVPLRNSGVSPVSVTFAVRMANNIYTALTTPEINESHAVIEGTSGISIGIWQTDKLTTGCKFVPGYGSGGVAAEAFYWEVKGMAL